jgi:hypothetical protein
LDDSLAITSGNPDRIKGLRGVGSFYLLGVMHGHWDVPTDSDEAEAKVNMGIAIVVPARHIVEVLDQPELVEERERLENQVRQRNAPSMD